MASSRGVLRKSASDACSHAWYGLTPFRRRRVRHITQNIQADLQREALTTALASALQCPVYGLELCGRIARAANITYNGSLHATIIKLVAARAMENEDEAFESIARSTDYCGMLTIGSNIAGNRSNTKRINKRNSGLAADMAIETFIRLSSSARTTPAALVTVTDICARDQVVERRGTRAASVLRFIQYNRTLSTYAVYKAVFETFVEALDFQSALATLNYAHATFTHISIPDRAHWYDRFIYAALVRRELGVVDAALATKKQLGLPDDSVYARNIHIALEADRGNFREAVDAAQEMINAGHENKDDDGRIEPFTYAFLIKAAGQIKDVGAILTLYEQFEHSIGHAVDKFHQSLSLPTYSAVLHPHTQTCSNPQPQVQSQISYSIRTSDEAATDPTHAVFLALRLCEHPVAAVKLVERLHTDYSITFSPLLYSVVSETCFKARRLDLAIRLRKLVQKQYESKQTKTAVVKSKSRQRRPKVKEKAKAQAKATAKK